MCYDIIPIVSKMVNLVLQRGGVQNASKLRYVIYEQPLTVTLHLFDVSGSSLIRQEVKEAKSSKYLETEKHEQ